MLLLHFQIFLCNHAHAPLLGLLYPYLSVSPVLWTALNTYFWSEGQCPLIFWYGALVLWRHAVSTSAQLYPVQLCALFKISVLPRLPGVIICVRKKLRMLTSHSFLATCSCTQRARATLLPCDANAGKVLEAENAFFCSSHSFKLHRLQPWNHLSAYISCAFLDILRWSRKMYF